MNAQQKLSIQVPARKGEEDLVHPAILKAIVLTSHNLKRKIILLSSKV